jgi:hypothetical protein
MPLLVYLTGAAAGLERLERGSLLNMGVVVGGVLAASYGTRLGGREGQGARRCRLGERGTAHELAAAGHGAAARCAWLMRSPLPPCPPATTTPGEVRFVPLGVALQAASLAAEAGRLVLVQLLLQGRGVRLNPITTM